MVNISNGTGLPILTTDMKGNAACIIYFVYDWLIELLQKCAGVLGFLLKLVYVYIWFWKLGIKCIASYIIEIR